MPIMPAPPRPSTQNQCRPAMKNSPAQTSVTSMVCPKSGCNIRGMMVSGSSSSAIAVPGTSRRRAPSEKAQATMMTKAGLRNSEGCTVNPPMDSQRRAPFTSGPM